MIDPWAGAGTTNLAATRLGRPNIYVDINPDFAELARGRLAREAAVACDDAENADAATG